MTSDYYTKICHNLQLEGRCLLKNQLESNEIPEWLKIKIVGLMEEIVENTVDPDTNYTWKMLNYILSLKREDK